MRHLRKIGFLLAMALLAAACSTAEPVTPNNGGGEENGENNGNGNNEPVIENPIPAELDANPEQFEGFRRRIMVLEHTGITCGFCPYVIGALNRLGEDEATKDKFITVAAHNYNPYSPLYNSAASDALLKWHRSGGAPFANFDLRTTKDAIMDGTSESIDTDARKMGNIINTLGESPAKAGIAATVKGDGGEIVVTAYVKIAEAGKYKINAWLLEDNIKEYQRNYGAEGYDFETHNHVLRGSFSEPVEGIALGNGDLAKGDRIVASFSLKPKPDLEKIENYRVVIFVTTPDNPSSSKYYATNIVSCPIGKSVAMEYAR